MLRKIKDVRHHSTAEGVDGLGVVAHGHDVAVFSRKQPHKPRLHQVGVLIFVHHDVGIAAAQHVADVRVLQQQTLQLEEQVVVVHEPLGALGLGVFHGQALYVRLIAQQVIGLAVQNGLDGDLLVARFADDIGQGGALGVAAVALAQVQVGLELAHQVLGVRAVHEREALRIARFLRVAAQHGIGEGVEGAAAGPGERPAQHQPRAVQHFLAGAAGEGQKQDVLWRDVALHQMRQAVDDGARFAAARAGNDQHRPAHVQGGLALGRVQLLLEIYAHSIRPLIGKVPSLKMPLKG